MKYSDKSNRSRIFEIVRNTISEFSLIDLNDTLILALSGGPDSICLADILKELKSEYGFKILAVHVNHSLRGKDSEEDADFVFKYCKEKEIPLDIFKVDVNEYAKKTGRGTEEAARVLRYKKLREVADREKGKIVIAHHMQDQAETVILNLLRGAGTSGLKGMKPKSGNIIRPMIYCPKNLVMDHLESRNITYRNDETNSQSITRRNTIRLELIPYLEKNFRENIVESIFSTSVLCGQDDEYLYLEAKKIWMKHSASENSVSCEIIINEHIAIASRILRLLYKKVRGDMNNLTMKHIKSLISLCDSPEEFKKTDLSDGFCGWIKNNCLFITLRKEYEEAKYELMKTKNILKEQEVELKIPMNLEKKVLGTEIFSDFIVNKEDIVYNAMAWCFPYKSVDGAVLRHRRPGDRIRPNRNSGSKALKDYLIDIKIPAAKRDSLVLLAKGSNILWIAGVKGVIKCDKNPDEDIIVMRCR